MFARYNFCIKYPAFYVRILLDILGDKMTSKLPSVLLGGIVECHVRGVLPNETCFEYRDTLGNEVDYCSYKGLQAVEISISNKRKRDTHFDCVPDMVHCTLLTKDITDEKNGIKRIPYYQFIYDQTVRRENSSTAMDYLSQLSE